MRVKAAIIGCLAIAIAAFGFGKKEADKPYPFPALPDFPRMPLAEQNPVTISGVRLGRFLFYDAILSSDSNMACASCHRQEAAFSDGPNQFSKGRNGQGLHRNTPPLFNLAWYPRLFWDGRAASIEEQVFHPVRAHDEMNMQWESVLSRLRRSPFYSAQFKAVFHTTEIDSSMVTRAIAQFERTLISYRSKYDQVINNEARFTQEEYEGFDIVNDMAKGDCLHCHSTDGDALGVVPIFSNNGLDKAQTIEDYKDKGVGGISKQPSDYGRFKVPSLRNVALTAPYMHDGRFNTLKEVLDFYSEGVNTSINVDSKMGFAHQGGVRLSEADKWKVIAFLNTLTDSAFIHAPEFDNPFLGTIR